MRVKYVLKISVQIEYTVVCLVFWEDGIYCLYVLCHPEICGLIFFLTRLKPLHFIVFQHHSDAAHPWAVVH